jgi:hypothetical protein
MDSEECRLLAAGLLLIEMPALFRLISCPRLKLMKDEVC